MQLYIINWSFQNCEDQLYATNEFCEWFSKGKINESIEGFELNFLAHTPQDGSGIMVCKAQNAAIICHILKMWRDNYGILFDIKPALTNEELLSINSVKDFWTKD